MKKTILLTLTIIAAIGVAVFAYLSMNRSSFDSRLMDKLLVDDMTYSKSHGWVFIKHENYNGEFVLYIEGLHRIAFAVPAKQEAEVSGKPDITIRTGQELRIYGDTVFYGGKQYTILEYGAYSLPLWASECLLSGEVKAFTSLGRELADAEYTAFPIIDAIALFRVSPLAISPYANYFIDVTECRVYDDTIEYLLSDGASVIFQADTMEYVSSTDIEIDRAYREGEPEHDHADEI